jgi:hypothetical protein
LANPILIIGACAAVFVLVRKKKDDGDPPGNRDLNTSFAPPEKKAHEPLMRAGANTSLAMVDEIVKEIGLAPDLDFGYPEFTGVEAREDETLFSYFVRLASWHFNHKTLGNNYYNPNRTPLNSTAPECNFKACNRYYLVTKPVTDGSQSWQVGDVLHYSNKSVALIKDSLLEFSPDAEWQRSFDDIVDECIKFYLRDGVNVVAARLLMFCILCGESFGIAVMSQQNFNMTGFKMLAKCQAASPENSEWLFRQFVRYFGMVRYATFAAYVGTYRSTGKDFLKKMFGCFEPGDYAKMPQLRTLKEGAGL